MPDPFPVYLGLGPTPKDNLHPMAGYQTQAFHMADKKLIIEPPMPEIRMV